MCDDSCGHVKDQKPLIETHPRSIENSEYQINGIHVGHPDNLVGHHNIVLLQGEDCKLKWDSRYGGLYVQSGRSAEKRDKFITESQLNNVTFRLERMEQAWNKHDIGELRDDFRELRDQVRELREVRDEINTLREQYEEMRDEMRDDINNLTAAMNESRQNLQAVMDFCFTDRSRWKEGQSKRDDDDE